MYRIEFGHNEGPKWIPELTLSYGRFHEAKTILQTISGELEADNEYHRSLNTSVKMFGPDEHLYHYISATYPSVSLPSYEKTS